jgi:DUF3025 family protein
MNVPFRLDWLARRPYRDLHPRLRHALASCADWPEPQHYDELARQVPRADDVQLPSFVAQDSARLKRLGGYEQHVAQLSAVPTRPGNWHDFFNMLVWAHFPKLRWALNCLHVDPTVGPKDPRNGRAPAQNLAATFDESGMLVLSTSASLIEDLRGLKFKRVFWDRRDEVTATTHFWLVGHGALEALLEPLPGLCARAMLLHVPALPTDADFDARRFELDAQVAQRIDGWRTAQSVLDPIPLLAIPGYFPNDFAEFYDDLRQIRFVPTSRRPAGAPT